MSEWLYMLLTQVNNLYRTPSSPYVIHSEEAVCQRSMTKYGGAGSKITGTDLSRGGSICSE